MSVFGYNGEYLPSVTGAVTASLIPMRINCTDKLKTSCLLDSEKLNVQSPRKSAFTLYFPKQQREGVQVIGVNSVFEKSIGFRFRYGMNINCAIEWHYMISSVNAN